MSIENAFSEMRHVISHADTSRVSAVMIDFAVRRGALMLQIGLELEPERRELMLSQLSEYYYAYIINVRKRTKALERDERERIERKRILRVFECIEMRLKRYTPRACHAFSL